MLRTVFTYVRTRSTSTTKAPTSTFIPHKSFNSFYAYRMRLSALVALYATASAAQAQSQADYPFATTVSIQSIGGPISSVDPLARIHYNPTTLEAEITSYDAPDLGFDADLVRVGIYDKAVDAWASSTSALSVENFGKGNAPVITLSLDLKGHVLGVSCMSEKIDAGQTRDFGPKVKIMRMVNGKAPDLNRPIALSKEGKVEVEIPEKTFLQK